MEQRSSVGALILVEGAGGDTWGQQYLISPLVLCASPSLHPLSRLQAACHRLNLWPELQDHGGDYVSAALGPLTTLLEQGLESRIHLLAHSRPPVSEVR